MFQKYPYLHLTLHLMSFHNIRSNFGHTFRKRHYLSNSNLGNVFVKFNIED